MKHFNITQWADRVRGLASSTDREEMSAHLESGCARCEHIFGVLERVSALATTEAGLTVPDGVVRSTKAYFALNQPARRERLARLALALSFDSALEDACVNTRGADDSLRQLTFGSNDYTLDLTVEESEAGPQSAVAGYCLRQAGEPVAGAPVFLISRGRFAGQDTTGELGEFHFETELADPLELWVFDNADLPVAVSLNLRRAA